MDSQQEKLTITSTMGVNCQNIQIAKQPTTQVNVFFSLVHTNDKQKHVEEDCQEKVSFKEVLYLPHF